MRRWRRCVRLHSYVLQAAAHPWQRSTDTRRERLRLLQSALVKDIDCVQIGLPRRQLADAFVLWHVRTTVSSAAARRDDLARFS